MKRKINKVCTCLLLLSIACTCILTPHDVKGNSYGFDYKFMMGGSIPRDPEVYTPVNTDVKVTAREPVNNHGKLNDNDVSTSDMTDDYDYTPNTLSENTINMLSSLKPITGSTLEESLSNWDSSSDVFTYSIKEVDGHEYIEIMVKDFSNGIDLADLFQMSPIDILELNTEQENGYETNVLMHQDSVSIALTPKVKNPGNYEFLLEDSVVVVIKPEGEVKPLSINSSALSNSLENILKQNELDKPEEMVTKLPSSLNEITGVDDKIQENVEMTQNEESATPESFDNNVVNPIDFIGEMREETGAGDFNPNTIDSYIGNEVAMVDEEPSANFFEMSRSYSDIDRAIGNNISTYGQSGILIDSGNKSTTSISSSDDILDTSGSYDIGTTYTVWVDGEEMRIKEIPDGYYIEQDEQGHSILKKKQLDLTGISFGRSWGIANKLEGDDLIKFANVDSTGNSLLKNVATQMKVNVDTLTGHNIRTFYTKPLPVRYHPIEQSDRIVVVYGQHNWIISIILCGAAVFISLVYFIFMSRHISKRLNELKRNYLIKDSEIVPNIENVDISAMKL